MVTAVTSNDEGSIPAVRVKNTAASKQTARVEFSGNYFLFAVHSLIASVPSSFVVAFALMVSPSSFPVML